MNRFRISRIPSIATTVVTMFLGTLVSVAQEHDVHTLYGSTNPPPGIRVIEIIDGFGSESADRWQLEKEAKQVGAEFGWSPPQFTGHVLRVPLQGQGVWALNRELAPSSAWADADGIRLVLAWKRTVRAWMRMTLTAGGKRYSKVLEPYDFVERELADRTVWFDELGDGDVKPDALQNLEILGSKQANTLYLVELQLVKKAVRKGWLRVCTNKPDTNFFEAGSDVKLTFRPEGDIPGYADGFRYEVTDYFENVVDRDTFGWRHGDPAARAYEATFHPPDPGYYEVRAWWTGGAEAKESVIREDGSMPFGITTFAVMPRTLEANRDDMTQNSFFGLHGHTHNLAEMVGAAWGIKGIRWKNYEKDVRPDRPNGATAAWARKAIESGPKPAWKFPIWNLTPQRGNIPQWARGTDDDFYKIRDWTDLELFVRDAVRVHKAHYPHMDPRIYDLMWEPDLQIGPKPVNIPEITSAELAEFYKRLAPIVRREDPKAFIVGPCFSSTATGKLAQMEAVFDADLVTLLDGLSLHPYHSIPPEQSNLMSYLRGVRELAGSRAGKSLPIYATEWGFQSYLGSQSRRREAAAWATRSNVILKGEGVRASLLFYSYDYGPPWGICYNLAPRYPERPWGPDRVAPKPAVPALAAQISVLNHTDPAGRISSLPDGVYGYGFTRKDQRIHVVWTLKDAIEIELPAGEKTVTVIDIMGRRTRRQAADGKVRVTARPDLKYVVVTRSALQR